MAKTIITQSGELINYSNVVSVSVDSDAKKDSQNNKLFPLQQSQQTVRIQ